MRRNLRWDATASCEEGTKVNRNGHLAATAYKSVLEEKNQMEREDKLSSEIISISKKWLLAEKSCMRSNVVLQSRPYIDLHIGDATFLSERCLNHFF